MTCSRFGRTADPADADAAVDAARRAAAATPDGHPLRAQQLATLAKTLRRRNNPADLTVHVEAGVTLGALQRALLDKNQFLPLDPWFGPQATIGGIAAMNAMPLIIV